MTQFNCAYEECSDKPKVAEGTFEGGNVFSHYSRSIFSNKSGLGVPIQQSRRKFSGISEITVDQR